jgi:putative ABC transport system substrate-binding protein
VLVGRSTPTTAALKQETDSIPIVFVNVAEPVRSGFVENLARPGGNITGFTNFEGSIGGKWLQLLKELDPHITRVAIIYNPQTAPFAGAFLRSVESAAPLLAVETIATPVQNNADIESSLTAFARTSGGGLIAIPDSFTVEHRDQIISRAANNRLPALYANRAFTLAGGLMSYAVDTRGLFQRSTTYVDRILNGARPSELPVQQPTKFDLVINLKTAKALGLEVPPMLVARADEVIE